MPAESADAAAVVNAAEPNQRDAQTEQSAVTQPETAPSQPEPRSMDGVMDSLGLPEEVKEEVRKRQEPIEPEKVEPEVEEKSDTEDEVVEEKDEEPTDSKEDWPASAVERVKRYKRQKAEAQEKAQDLEEEIASLKTQLNEAQPVTVASTMSDPLAHVTDLNGLEEERGKAKILRDYCIKNRDGYIAYEGTPQEKFISPEEVADQLIFVEDTLSEYIPKKRQELQLRPQFTEQAKQIMPSMFERGGQDNEVYRTVIQQYPHLVNDPRRDIIVAYLLKGMKAHSEEQKVAQNGNGKDAKLQVPEELRQQHLQRGKTPYLKQNPPSRTNGNTAPSPAKAKQEAMEDVLTDQSSANLGRAMRIMRDGTQAKDQRRPVTV